MMSPPSFFKKFDELTSAPGIKNPIFALALIGLGALAYLSSEDLQGEALHHLIHVRDEIQALFHSGTQSRASYSLGDLNGSSELDGLSILETLEEDQKEGDAEPLDSNEPKDWGCTLSDLGTEDCEGMEDEFEAWPEESPNSVLATHQWPEILQGIDSFCQETPYLFLSQTSVLK